MDRTKSERAAAEKFDIKLKTKPRDGVILQLHHTIRGSKGETHRIRFSTAIFDDTQEKLACADNVGNIFILDFAELKFWKLSGIGPSTALRFLPNDVETLVVATSKNYIDFIDIETGQVSHHLNGHTAPIKHISFSNNKLNNLLTSSPVEAILWEMTNYTKYFTLNTFLGAQIQQIMFTPAGDYLVACFQNGTVQIWKHESMKSVKQIIPTELKHLKNIAFTMNGRAMVMAGLASTLILFSMDNWKVIKSVDLMKYDITGVQQISFIPQVFDGGANKILAVLSCDSTLHLLDLDTLVVIHKICPESSGIRKFVVSPTGKYFLCILQLGEVNIYNTSFVMDIKQNTTEFVVKNDLPCTSKIIKPPKLKDNSSTKEEINKKMRTCMDSARLRRILMQYGEYPVKFRSMIWQSLLNIPKNRNAYSALLDKGKHPAYKDIDKHFTLHSTSSLKSLTRLLSCMAHWCPLFGVMKFLPGFVFPFVKVLQKDPLLLFECTATILLNNCQLWFEYAPFPPISILAIVENILAEHDEQLLEHYCSIGVTGQTYALKILETVFSEVLTSSEWLILWDHILSNEPAFILMAVVSYNVVQRNAIRKLTNQEQIENFFHMQNPIDKKAFLKKAYIFLNNTSDELHPRKFFHPFVSLEKGDCYQQFDGYPKATICMQLAEKKRKKAGKKSLKELTKNSQEREIERLRLEEDPFQLADLSGDDNIFEKYDNSKNKKRSNNQCRETRKTTKNKLNELAHDKNRGDSSGRNHDEKNVKSSKKKQSVNDCLEKAVEKLLHIHKSSG